MEEYGWKMPPDETVLLFVRSPMECPETSAFCITDKKIYLLRTDLQGNRVGSFPKIARNSIRIDSVQGFDCEQPWPDSNLGKLIFFSDELKNPDKKFELLAIPDIERNQRLIESLLWKYGNVRERLNRLQDDLDLEPPHTFKVSTRRHEELMRLKKEITQKTILALIIVVLIGIIFYGIIPLFSFNVLFIYCMNIYSDMYPFYSFYSIVQEAIGSALSAPFLCYVLGTLLILTIIPFLVFMGIKTRRIKKRVSQPNETMALNEGKIIIKSKQSRRKVNINKQISLIHFTNQPKDVLLIQPSLQADKRMTFGPVDDFDKVSEFLFLYILSWKKKSGYLIENPEKEKSMQARNIKKFNRIPTGMIWKAFCRHCGEEVQPNDRFCEKCGGKLQ